MPNPFVGEIRLFAGNFAPAGWAFCEGQLLSIAQNETLFSLLGTNFGGDGRTTYGLPDLRGRVPVHQGNGFTLGQKGGAEEVTLTIPKLPSHTHPMQATSAAGVEPNPAGKVPGEVTTGDIYLDDTPTVNMAAQAISSVGGGQNHNNMQPYMCINYIISLFGVYPSRN